VKTGVVDWMRRRHRAVKHCIVPTLS